MELILNDTYTLRSWKADDASSLAIHANNIKIARNLRDGFPYPYTLENANTWLHNAMNMEAAVILAIDHSGESIGGIGLSPLKDVYRKTAEIGYWLSEKYWNRGITTLAVKALVKYGFENLPVERIQAGIYENNFPSMNVLKKCGFHLEAIHEKAVIKDGNIMDEHLYVLLRDEYLKINNIL